MDALTTQSECRLIRFLLSMFRSTVFFRSVKFRPKIILIIYHATNVGFANLSANFAPSTSFGNFSSSFNPSTVTWNFRFTGTGGFYFYCTFYDDSSRLLPVVLAEKPLFWNYLVPD
ncbi:hypothetical protein AVEN_209601-1 [Araneus ventricosus]|uniref:Uncharacterized protein n=1 Tax=Araneus ventricosus TaxID=182803 RepID=A0A4Y2D8I9_ARAVE|nr:hypothetical protein AVEN_209601-1 [Araneus ventricosus]